MTQPKVFYIGFQRAGTKSFGDFMRLNGFKVASWDVSSANEWPEKYSNGDLGGILRSRAFRQHDAFEDGPWFCPSLAKFVYNEVKGSKFVLLTRPADDWFKSMIKHSAGLTPGHLRRHCELYDRLEDYAWLRENSDGFRDETRFSLFDKPEHYMAVYRKRTLEMTLFFERMPDARERFFSAGLYDKDVYRRVAEFLKLRRPRFPAAISHRTAIGVESVLSSLREGHDAVFRDVRHKMKQAGSGKER